jgi:hypothetical protein
MNFCSILGSIISSKLTKTGPNSTMGTGCWTWFTGFATLIWAGTVALLGACAICKGNAF